MISTIIRPKPAIWSAWVNCAGLAGGAANPPAVNADFMKVWVIPCGAVPAGQPTVGFETR